MTSSGAKSLTRSVTPTVLLLVALATAAVTGCTSGPDFQPPDKPDAGGYTPEPLTATASADIAYSWMTGSG